MQLLLGRPADGGAPVVWKSDEALNPHILIIGMSGVGKSHLLRRMIQTMAGQSDQFRAHVIDAHGDLNCANESVVTFSEQGQYGLNPLALDSSPEHGGPRKAINRFITMLNRAQWQLGPNQQSVLHNLLLDAFAEKGVNPRSPATWHKTDALTLEGVRDFAWRKMATLYTGVEGDAYRMFESLARAVSRLQKTVAKDEALEDISQAKEKCVVAYAEALSGMQSGTELQDLFKYGSIEVLKSLCHRIGGLSASGVFRDTPPPFAPTASVCRYNLPAMADNELRLFTDTLAEQLLHSAKAGGVQNDLRTMLVCDEANKVVDPDTDHVLNRTVREARKYGHGLVLASQQINDFSDDILANVGTTIILGVADYYQEGLRKRLGLASELFSRIVLQKTGLVQYRRRVGVSNGQQKFQLVELPG